MASVASVNQGTSQGSALTTSDTGVGSNQSTSSTAVQVVQTAYDVTKILTSKGQEEDKLEAARERIAIAVADYYTGGYASVLFNFANKQWGGTMDKIRKFDAKYNLGTIITNKLFDTDRWKKEGNRLSSLAEKGIQIPQELMAVTKLERGRFKEELVDPGVPANFVGTKADGTWVNNAFATERDESLLRPEDIWGYASFFEKFGNDWLGTFTADQRRAIAGRALELGCVREHHGTIDITWSPALEQFAAQQRSAGAKT